MNAPNALTISRIVFAPIFVILLFQKGAWPTYMATLFFLLAGLSDYWDGYLARKRGEVTKLGRFLDPLADKILTSASFISFAFMHIIEAWMVYVMIAREVGVTALRVYAIWRKRPLVTSRLAKWKTSLQMTVIFAILVLLCVQVSRSTDGRWDLSPGSWLLWVINGLVFGVMLLAAITGIHYLVQNAILPRKREGGKPS